ncbi:MAG: pyridoxal phosphate-dependent aminotransferase, partial [Chitinophagales bacterium]
MQLNTLSTIMVTNFDIEQQSQENIAVIDPYFSHDQINLPILQQRAYNLRWATVEDGVIPLTAADPDFPIAPEIRQAITNYVSTGVLSYGPAEGLPSLRHAIDAYFAQPRQIPSHPDWILPTNSAAHAMFLTAQFALEKGEEAIIFDPVDFLFKKSVESAGGKAVYCPVSAITGRFDPEVLAKLITDKTRLICVCNPHNPLGKSLTKTELECIADLAIKHNLWIMSDEIWSDIVYSDAQHISIASLSEAVAQRTITIFGFSKSYGLAGLRVGCLLAPNATVFEQIINLSMVRTTAFGVSTLSQIAAQAALEHCDYWLLRFKAHLENMRNYAYQRLIRMPNVSCQKPDGTYVIFPNIRG